MIYSIENEFLKISVNTDGAELYSVYSKKTQTEYLWQGDERFWKGRAYNLFPFIGRMVDGVYTYQGERFTSRTHGLARYFSFDLETRTENALTFLLKNSEEMRQEYPFSFEFRVSFILNANALTTQYAVTNTDNRTLICAFGGHPGFNVPFGKGEFESYYLEFSAPTSVRRQLLVEGKAFMAEKSLPYPLIEGVKIPLRHELFDNDAVILENTSGCVSIKSDEEKRSVSVQYSDFPFVGFWHINKPNAPYVCIEPWSALPAVDGVITDLENKLYMTHVVVGESAVKSFTITINE